MDLASPVDISVKPRWDTTPWLEPDLKKTKPDQKLPKPDQKLPKPDQKLPKPDSKPPLPDATPPIAWKQLFPGTPNDLYGVWGSSDTEVWIGGDSIAGRFDGSTWNLSTLYSTMDFHDVWGYSTTSSSIVNFVGYRDFDKGACWARRSAGGSWSPHFESQTFRELNGVHGRSSGKSFAVGSKGLVYTLNSNNSTWKTFSLTPIWGVRDFYDVHTDGSGNTVIVGSQGIVVRLKLEVYKANLSLSGQKATGVWAKPGGGMFITSEDGAIYSYDLDTKYPVSYYSAGTKWQDIRGNGKDVYAVGYNNHDGLIVRYSGSKWSKLPTIKGDSQKPKYLQSVWASSADKVYVVGKKGVVYRY